MPRRVFVTGIGVISAIGRSVDETLISIVSERSGIGSINFLNTIHKEIPVAEVKFSDKELSVLANVEGAGIAYTRTALLGLIAVKEAVAKWAPHKMTGSRTGLISATTVGGMPVTERYYKGLLTHDTHKEYIESFDCGDCAEKIADFLGIKHHIATINTACSSSANSIMLGARLIRNNYLDRVIVGGTDSLTRFTLNGFRSFEILDASPCKPFDENRKGLTIGEGAGFLVLEAEDIAEKNSIICELTGYGNANDAFHLTASSPDGQGAALAMKKALSLSGLATSDIDYINAHGTGTDINDLSEGKAIESVFATAIPKVSSTKSFTGHTLGASGGIEAVLSVLALKHRMILPNLNFVTQMKELSFAPVGTLEKNAGVKNVMSNSFGFGGNNTSLIFSTC